MDNRTKVIYEEGIKYYKNKNYELAASIFVKLANNEVNNSSINFFAGLSLFILKKYSSSVSFFNKVIDLKDNYQQTMKSCLFLGCIYIQEHKNQDAFNILKIPVEANFKDPYVYSLMGYITHQNKKYKEADTYFKKCLEMDPENPLFNNNYGYNLLVWKKDFYKCSPYLEKAISKKKKNSAYLHSLGWGLYYKKRYSEAEKILSQALKLQKNKNQVIKKHLDMVKKKMTSQK